MSRFEPTPRTRWGPGEGAWAEALPPVPEPLAMASLPRSPMPARRGPRTWRLLGACLGLLTLIAMALAVAAIVGSATGAVGFLLGVVLALVPVPAVVAAFMWVDRHEPEPARLLAFAFAWGAIVAALVAVVLNTVSAMVVEEAVGRDAGLTATAVVIAPVIEEASKGLGVLVIVLAVRREFDGVVDGIVCAGLVGIGFAFTENVLYYGRAYVMASQLSPGSEFLDLGVTFVLRGVLSPFAHPLFTVMTGIGLGLAAHSRFASARIAAPLLGFAAAVSLHAAWNLAAVSGLSGFTVSYALFMVPIFVVAVAVAAWVSARESAAIARGLPAYVRAGWLPAYDVPMISSASGRRRARSWARDTQGRAALRAMTDYQDAAAELALLRDRAQRGRRVPAFRDREAALLRELARARSGFVPVLR